MSKDFEELFACLRHRNVRVAFDEAWSGRVAGRYGAQAVEYIGRADLIRNKRASGRPQDLLDIDSLT